MSNPEELGEQPTILAKTPGNPGVCDIFFRTSLHVLHLLPDLLNQHLDIHGMPRGLRIRRF